eukprot:scaffold289940_cov19-Tisochrysis_lutea.AAC.1
MPECRGGRRAGAGAEGNSAKGALAPEGNGAGASSLGLGWGAAPSTQRTRPLGKCKLLAERGAEILAEERG